MYCIINFKSLTQLPGVRVTSPPVQQADQLHTATSTTSHLKTDASTSLGPAECILRPPDFRLSFDDYDADLELAWLGYVLATCQSETHLNVPAATSEYGGYNSSGAGGYNQRLAVSSFDISQYDQYSQDAQSLSPFSSNFSSYARSRSDTCLAPDRCAKRTP